MRIKYAKLITFFIIISNILIVYYTWRYFLKINKIDERNPILPVTQKSTKQKDRIQSTNKHIKKSVTVIFRDFYPFETDLKNSIESLVNLVPTIQIIVVFDQSPYPPLEFFSNSTVSFRNNVKLFFLDFDVTKTAKELNPIGLIKTKYCLFLPDSVRLNGRAILQKIIREISNIENHESKKEIKINNNNKYDILSEQKVDGAFPRARIVQVNTNKIEVTKSYATIQKIIAIPFYSNNKGLSNCCAINVDFTNWTIEYETVHGTENCDMFLQKHAIMVETSLLKEMPSSLSTPFPEMFYIQAKILNKKKVLMTISMQDGKRLFTSYHSKQRRLEIRKEQFKAMYKKLQLKKIVTKTYKQINQNNQKSHKKHETLRKQIEHKQNNNNNNNDIFLDPPPLTPINLSLPLFNDITYYGCEKNTQSCIGQVFNRRPFYMYLKKHTPPCCIEKLKSVFHHVIEEFENVGIRYWLDNTALKSAIDTNTISMDAYEIDISFNIFDLSRSSSLKKCQTRPFTDEEGFYWIKATDGQYFKVLYSKINQIGVNLLPFDLNGERVKPNGFYGWKAKEFSVEFLHPMSTLQFLGKNIMCPNNVREFLEIKANK